MSCLSFLLQLLFNCFYYLGIYFRFIFYKKKAFCCTCAQEPVSVIICARNEADNLDNYLPVILSQDYPDYEVIVVNDCSTDNSDIILKKYLEQYPQLRISTIKEDKKFSHGKKLAVTIGIKAAKYDRLLFTDGDCKPESNQWLSLMAANFSADTSIVLGYGGYFPQPGLLNKYIRYDTLMIALQYFSFALCKIPYMGVGRNLAYKRSLFYAGKGFSTHFHLASGDDDLFVNENATKTNTAIELSLMKAIPVRRPKSHMTNGIFKRNVIFPPISFINRPISYCLRWNPSAGCFFMPVLPVLVFFPVIQTVGIVAFCLSPDNSAHCY